MVTSLPIMPDAAVLYGLALSGGHSRRMGRDKAALSYASQPQLVRVMAMLQTLCARSFVSARSDQHDALRQRWDMLVDEHDHIGPMAGLLAAQAAHPDAAWLVVACDLPLLTLRDLQQLVAARDGIHATLAMAIPDQPTPLPEPMCSLWEPASAAAVQAALRSGNHSLSAVLQAMHTRLVTPENSACLRNINTLQDYQALGTELPHS